MVAEPTTLSEDYTVRTAYQSLVSSISRGVSCGPEQRAMPTYFACPGHRQNCLEVPCVSRLYGRITIRVVSSNIPTS
jgi:hypothetical protein